MPDATTLATWGLPGLFLVAMVAGSILAAPSEAVLAALVYGGVSPASAVGVATAGNVLGSLSVYLLGRWVSRGGGGPLGRWLQRRIDQEGPRLARARARLATWGAPCLLLAWLPVVGDVFVLAAGLVGVRWGPFLGFVSLGKGLRYLVVALSALAVRHTGISP
ncbi:YqaA family protein [Archangium primigenium]|uniref:YqaA family protein n=1 Tax=[Archangium] primigenium TaxID=2792470 RepID=UPI00195BFA4F|nr:VTT domain-containing protein [Archangium primigenium]MBM7118364.1 DedA family protein [Archangium primigenium]